MKQTHNSEMMMKMNDTEKELLLQEANINDIITQLNIETLKLKSEIARTKMFLTINNNKNALNYATHATNRTDEILDYITTLKQELALYL